MQFCKPSRAIFVVDDLRQFVQSDTYAGIMHFLGSIVNAVKGKNNQINLGEGASMTVKSILNIVNLASEITDSVPPEKQAARFGNKAFRTWHTTILSRLPEKVASIIPSDQQQACVEVIAYLFDSFGNTTRIDYGTGHEVNFVLFLYCFWKLGLLIEPDLAAVGLCVLPRYFTLVRKLIFTYNLEPAGSHGVWSLDDYSFLPFLLGSSQLIGHKFVKPKSILYMDTVEAYEDKYMYLGTVANITRLKSGPFKEHSHILYDIASNLKGWGNICQGLRRMFEVEVMGKLPVMQHLTFGSIVRSTWEVKTVDAGKLKKNPFAKPEEVFQVSGTCTLTKYFNFKRSGARSGMKPTIRAPPAAPTHGTGDAQFESLEDGKGILLKGWKISSNKGTISDEDTFNAIKDNYGITFSPPEMFFGSNYVRLSHVESGISYNFGAMEALAGCKVTFDANGNPDRRIFKHSLADTWSKRADHNVAIAKNTVTDFDWTYTTYYSGHFSCTESGTPANVAVSNSTEDSIDYARLRQRDPILWHDAVNLFEAELDDNGNGQLNVKIRVMPSCFFCLSRFWLRVDGMLLRVLDTRLYHVFGTDKLVFEKSVREITYDQLKSQGMSTNDRDYTDPDKFVNLVPVVKQWNEVAYLRSQKQN